MFDWYEFLLAPHLNFNNVSFCQRILRKFPSTKSISISHENKLTLNILIISFNFSFHIEHLMDERKNSQQKR